MSTTVMRIMLEEALAENRDFLVHDLRDDEFAVEATALVMKTVREAGYDFVHTTDHFMDITERGWAIQHSTVCRPDMLNCPVHHAVEWHDHHDPQFFPEKQGPGRYKITLIDKDWTQFSSSIPTIRMEKLS